MVPQQSSSVNAIEWSAWTRFLSNHFIRSIWRAEAAVRQSNKEAL